MIRSSRTVDRCSAVKMAGLITGRISMCSADYKPNITPTADALILTATPIYPTPYSSLTMSADQKPTILHIGDPIKYNHELYQKLEEKFTIIRPSAEERQRGPFLEALRQKKWGDFQAVMRPFWITGGEMGRWDRELIPLLPKSVKVYASAGAGYDWADVDVMAEAGILYCNGAAASSEAVADMALYHIISVFRNMQWSNMAARGSEAEFREPALPV